MDREIDIGVRRRRTARRVVVGTIAVLGGAGLLIWASEWLRPSVHRARVRLATVDVGDLEATVQASGSVVPASERVLSSPVEVRVDKVLRRPGETLDEGDVILELDTSNIGLRLELLEEKLAQSENEAEQRRLKLDDAVADLESRIETQILDLEIANYRLEQKQKLLADGLISEEAHKQAEVEVKKATIQLRRLREEIEAARRTYDSEVVRLELDASILRKERDDFRRQLELATTRSPVRGVLTWVADEVGATLPAGAVLARIADMQSFRVEASVSDAYASRIEVGQPVKVLLGNETLSARLSGVEPTIESGVQKFHVELDEPSHAQLRHNLRVDVLVVTDYRPGVLRAPRGPYVQQGGRHHQVFVVRGDRAHRVDIELGLAGHEFYEVVSGLAQGDEIILSDMRSQLHARELRVK